MFILFLQSYFHLILKPRGDDHLFIVGAASHLTHALALLTQGHCFVKPVSHAKVSGGSTMVIELPHHVEILISSKRPIAIGLVLILAIQEASAGHLAVYSHCGVLKAARDSAAAVSISVSVPGYYLVPKQKHSVMAIDEPNVNSGAKILFSQNWSISWVFNVFDVS